MSMRDAGILDGDIVAVHRTPEVRNRQIVVARLENEVTVKRYRTEGHRVWLLPENPDFTPIQVDLHEQNMSIEGVVVGVVRDVDEVSLAKVSRRPLTRSRCTHGFGRTAFLGRARWARLEGQVHSLGASCVAYGFRGP